MKSTRLTKLASEKLTFCIWAPSVHTINFLEIPPVQFYLWSGLHKLLTRATIHRGERPKERKKKECGKYTYTTTYNT
jgi:hypothetical protein